HDSFFFQAEDGIRDFHVTGVQTCALPISDFLSAANPRWWPQADMRAAMRTHLDQTLAEAAHELAGDYAASVADYEEIHSHILARSEERRVGKECRAGRLPNTTRRKAARIR